MYNLKKKIAKICRYAYKCCSDKINYANKLRMAQLTELELSVLFHVFALKKAQNLFGPNQCFKLALNNMFEALKMQYTCEEVALRIGAILLLLGDFDVSLFEKWVIIVKIKKML